MTAILRFKDENGNWIDVPALVGPTGTSITGIEKIGRTGDIVGGFIDTYRIDFSNGESTTFEVQNGAQGQKGDKGDQGEINVGTVTTLNAGEEATVETTEIEGKTYLNFGIPKGSTTVTFVDWGEEV